MFAKAPLFIDLIIVSLLVYVLLVWLKRTRARLVLVGLSLAGGVYLLARQFNLVLTTTILQWFFAAILIVIVVIFQEEIRSFFERMAVVSFGRGFGKKKRKAKIELHQAEIEVLLDAMFGLAHNRIGALVVIRGVDPIDRHIDGGIELNGNLSEPIISSIFDASSSGHDGAVVLNGNRIEMFAAHLPLSKNLEEVGKGGTRHSAALGLAEFTDALCIVVSEERGTVSVARNSELSLCRSRDELEKILKDHYRRILPKSRHNGVKRWLVYNLREKFAAVSVTFVLWYVVIYGSEVIYKSYTMPIEVSNLSEKLSIGEIEPKEVEVAFSGPRRIIQKIGPHDITLHLDASEWKKGARSVRIIDTDVAFPADLLLRSVGPTRDIKVVVEAEPGKK